MNIAVTGYYGTGSSAVIDLLCEFNNVKPAIDIRYEHYPFLGKNALFDLEARLFSENSNYMIRDYALNEFVDEMERQNKYNFGWFGSYKKLFGDKFKNLVDEFVNSISVEKACKSFTQVKKVKHTPLKAFLQVGARIILKRKIYDLGRVYVYNKKPMRFLIVDHDTFIKNARKFVNGYFQMCKTDSVMVYDHLLLPEQANLVNKFFDKDFRLIIVDRDPRDVYLLSEHIWSTPKFGCQKGIYPDGIKGFCGHYICTHNFLHKLDDKMKEKILFVQFEDLVYNYEETKEKIIKFCALKEKDHAYKFKFFDPNKSIHNTQIFNLNEDYKKEIDNMKELEKFFYKFPYEKKDKGEIFD